MTNLEKTSINNSIQIINQILAKLEIAIKKFTHARNWGFFDIFGGGFLTDLIKHSNLNAASYEMNEINNLLQKLRIELNNVVIPGDYSMNNFSFSTMADFFFDGLICDIYMQSKIMNSLNALKDLQEKLFELRNKLTSLR